MLDFAENKTQNESRQGEALAPFGGDPNDPANTTWVDREQHGQLVAWWNERYETASAGSA